MERNQHNNKMEASKEWTPVAWHANPAIKIQCWQKGKTVLHREFICTNMDANDGYGEWKEGTRFAYTEKGSHSGLLPVEITELVDAQEFIDNK